MEYIGKLEYDYVLKEEEASIVVFGAGALVHSILNKLEMEGIKKKVVCICDNNPGKSSAYIDDIKVISFIQACEWYHDAHFIVYNKYVEEMAKQLIKAGITRIHYILF